VFDTALGPVGVEWGDAGITEVLMPGRSGLAEAWSSVTIPFDE